MKVLVIYDSLHGNTEKIARAIGDAFAAPDTVQVHRVTEVNPAELASFDLVIVGSPTQGGRATQAIQDFLDRVPESAIKGIKLAAFDTRMSTRWVGVFGYAAGRIADLLKERGAIMVAPPQAFFVKGKEGPLKDGELERAANWAKGIAEPQ